MSFFVVGIFQMGFLIGCGLPSQENVDRPDTTELVSVQPNDTPTTEEASRDQLNQRDFVVQELSQLTSPFTKERVVVLNAIVEKSLAVITEFDEARKGINQEDQKQLNEFARKLQALSKRAVAARQSMADAKVDLENSGEEYNKPIFAAMVKFVDDVDEEIRNEIEVVRKATTDKG